MKEIEVKFIRDFDYDIFFDKTNICFIDIETTGFNRSKNLIYLIGILSFSRNNRKWCLKQFFAENLNEEKEILLRVSEILPHFDKIITFNGDAFDIPYINYRLSLAKIPYEIDINKSLDIYKIVKENKQYLELDSLKLKSLEQYLGLFREDIYTGKDCIGFYYKYIKSKDKSLFNNILQHNYDDLYYMIDIIKIFDIIYDKKSVMINYKENEIKLLIETMDFIGDQLHIKGNILSDINLQLFHYDSEFNYTLNQKDFEFIIDCYPGLVSPTERGYYVNQNNLVLSNLIIDSTKYKLPREIILLKVENKLCVENIKSIMKAVISDSIKQY